MKWFSSIFGQKSDVSLTGLDSIQRKFSSFLKILDNNNKVLKALSDMEEKSQGEYLFDINYIRSSLAEIRSGTKDMILNMIRLGGKDYSGLMDCFNAIDIEIVGILPGGRAVEKDDYVIPFRRIGRDRIFSVGSKNAQLGEMKSVLGLPVPGGFAISAWAYKKFIDDNDLQNKINALITSLDFKRYQDLLDVSEKIREMVLSSPVPEELADEIDKAYQNLKLDYPTSKFAMRSSAIGEDTLFSFAGQYRTFLNVPGDQLINRYRGVLASKFTPQAIYYILSHSLSEYELSMCVGCVTMVDAEVSGVVYTRDPIHPENGCLVVNSIFGLGEFLVDGTLTPDVFRISRDDYSIKESQISHKHVMLTTSDGEGTMKVEVPEVRRNELSLSHEQIRQLSEYAVIIEKHYDSPQDIEWAIDKDGNIFLLQTRPLHIVEPRQTEEPPDISAYEVVAKGGTLISPGAGGGKVWHVLSSEDLPDIPEGAVLVAPSSFPGIVTVMDKVSAIITEVGGVASHMATIAREYRIPTIGGFKDTELLKANDEVTVDATNKVIYKGMKDELIKALKPDFDQFDDINIFGILENVLKHLAPLNIISSRDENFLIKNCRTIHDILRFCHQKSMEEMFYGALDLEDKENYSLRLKSDIPLNVNIIFVDQDYKKYEKNRIIDETEIASAPMVSLWKGIKEEGWPSPPAPSDAKGFMSVLTTTMTQGNEDGFAENSFAILGKEYMMVSLRMGYHFTTIEALAAPEANKNYIKFQFKAGGAAIERRTRRIELIVNIMKKLGFENNSKGDFLDASISYIEAETVISKLYYLGRITMLTKQLDMALSNDSIAKWYTNDILKKLGLSEGEGL
ncbi:MAG: hypothetical protein GY855_12415 [candidate division Zixibacteria bacterium]|nr:hypothetical protein [candidate division Zixibacteria bacterium]